MSVTAARLRERVAQRCAPRCAVRDEWAERMYALACKAVRATDDESDDLSDIRYDLEHYGYLRTGTPPPTPEMTQHYLASLRGRRAYERQRSAQERRKEAAQRSNARIVEITSGNGSPDTFIVDDARAAIWRLYQDHCELVHDLKAQGIL